MSARATAFCIEDTVEQGSRRFLFFGRAQILVHTARIVKPGETIGKVIDSLGNKYYELPEKK